MAKIIAVCNQKGGVGKTTTSVNLAACLAVNKQRTLLIDCDPQGNATSGIGLDKNADQPTVYDLLLDPDVFETVVQSTCLDYLFCLPTNIALIGAEVELVDEEDRHLRLKQALQGHLDHYDYCIIDAPPSLGLLTVNILTAADSVLIPLQCEYYALEGISLLADTIERVQEGLNPDLEIEGVLLTMFDSRTNLSNQVADEVRKHFAENVFQTVIPRSIRLSEAPSFGKPVILYDFRSTGSQAYISLCEELMNGSSKESAGSGSGRPDSTRQEDSGRTVEPTENQNGSESNNDGNRDAGTQNNDSGTSDRSSDSQSESTSTAL